MGVKTKTQLLAEKSVFKKLLITVIAVSGEPDLLEPKDEFVVNVCRHFAMMLHITWVMKFSGAENSQSGSGHASIKRSKTSPSSNLKELDPLVFLDALVGALSDDNRCHAKAALSALNVFSQTLLFLGSKHADKMSSKGLISDSTPSKSTLYLPHSIYIPIFDQLLSRLVHCCYGTKWQAQMGGVMGLGALVVKVPVETLCHFQVKIMRALVYVLKRLPNYANKEQKETAQVLTDILHAVSNSENPNFEPLRESFHGAVDYLASELFNPNLPVRVRKTLETSLSNLATRTGSEISGLLEPLYQPLLQPLLMRPLRSRPVDQQVKLCCQCLFVFCILYFLVNLSRWLTGWVSYSFELLPGAEAPSCQVNS